MKALILLLALSVLSITTGCATVVKGNDQTISVTTSGCEAEAEMTITCQLQNKDNDVYVDAPGTVSIEKGSEALSVTCASTNSMAEGSATIESTYESMNVGNIILGGGIGVIVDAASGAMWKFPKTVEIPMRCGEQLAEDMPDTSPGIEATSESDTEGHDVREI